MAMEEVLRAIEEFARSHPTESLPRHKPAQLAGLGREIHEQARFLLERGLVAPRREVEEGGLQGFGGFDWVSPKALARLCRLFSELAPQQQAAERDLLWRGLPLTYSEPQLIVMPEGPVYHYSIRDPLTPPVTADLQEFLRHWLAAGCFSSHHYGVYSRRIRGPELGIRPADNLWLRHYGRYYGDQSTG